MADGLTLKIDVNETVVFNCGGETVEITHRGHQGRRIKLKIQAPANVLITRRHPEKDYTGKAATGQLLGDPPNHRLPRNKA